MCVYIYIYIHIYLYIFYAGIAGKHPKINYIYVCVGTAVAQWLRCCATNWKVAGSIPDGVIGIFH